MCIYIYTYIHVGKFEISYFHYAPTPTHVHIMRDLMQATLRIQQSRMDFWFYPNERWAPNSWHVYIHNYFC